MSLYSSTDKCQGIQKRDGQWYLLWRFEFWHDLTEQFTSSQSFEDPQTVSGAVKVIRELNLWYYRRSLFEWLDESIDGYSMVTSSPNKGLRLRSVTDGVMRFKRSGKENQPRYEKFKSRNRLGIAFLESGLPITINLKFSFSRYEQSPSSIGLAIFSQYRLHRNPWNMCFRGNLGIYSW